MWCITRNVGYFESIFSGCHVLIFYHYLPTQMNENLHTYILSSQTEKNCVVLALCAWASPSGCPRAVPSPSPSHFAMATNCGYCYWIKGKIKVILSHWVSQNVCPSLFTSEVESIQTSLISMIVTILLLLIQFLNISLLSWLTWTSWIRNLINMNIMNTNCAEA